MLYYSVIGLCIFLLLAVIYFSAKPINMGIEARRNMKDSSNEEKKIENENDFLDEQHSENEKKIQISDEIVKLNKLKSEGLLSEDEFKKAKEKLLS